MEIKNVITFGYAEKEENARKECEQAQAALEKWQKTAAVYDENNKCLDRTIQKIVAVCKENGIRENADVISKDYADLLNANISVLADDSVTGSLFAGAACGTAGAVGAFTLVGMFGTASTGVAISSLSGAAATTSTLAALGGGSLASGGLGMLGGMCALGGIAAAVGIPCVMTFGAYSSAKKYEAAAKEINDMLEKVPPVEAVEKQAEKLRALNGKIEKLLTNFNQGMFSVEKLYDSVKVLISENNVR